MEETWYYMKGRSLWTYEYMLRDGNYWHDSVKNKNNGDGENSSTGVCVKDEYGNLHTSNVTIKQEGDEEYDSFAEREKEQQPSTSCLDNLEEQLKVQTFCIYPEMDQNETGKFEFYKNNSVKKCVK